MGEFKINCMPKHKSLTAREQRGGEPIKMRGRHRK